MVHIVNIKGQLHQDLVLVDRGLLHDVVTGSPLHLIR